MFHSNDFTPNAIRFHNCQYVKEMTGADWQSWYDLQDYLEQKPREITDEMIDDFFNE